MLQIYIFSVKTVFKQCPTPPSVNNGKLQVLSRNAGSEAKVVCDSDYMVKGDPTYRCSSNGTWVGSGLCSENTSHILNLIRMAVVTSIQKE